MEAALGSAPLLRVLYMEHFGTGGMAHYAHCLCESLAQRGHSVSLLTAVGFELAGAARSYRLLNWLPMWDLTTTSTKRGLSRGAQRLGRGLRYLWSLALALATVWREAPDIVHVAEMLFLPDVFLSLCPRRSRVVHTCHNVERFTYTPSGGLTHSSRLWWHTRRLFYRRCAGLIFHTPENLEEFRQVFASEPARLAVIPHGEYRLFERGEAPHHEEARRQLGLDSGGRWVLFFGFIRRYKGLDTLVEAMGALSRSVPAARLLVAGSPGRDVDLGALQERARALGIAERVVWHTGYVPTERVQLYFSACDVVALPYRKVYDSGVLKIAQALGRPAVVADVGGLAAGVDYGAAGLVVPPEDPAALAGALQRLLLDRALAERLARRGRELARSRYSWERVAEQTERFYREVQEQPCAS